MALLYVDGFDAGDPAIKGWNGSPSTANSSPAPRFGAGRYLTTGGVASRSFTASAQIFVGVSVAASVYTTNPCPYITFYGDAGTTQHISVGITSTTIVVYRGGLGGTLLATSSPPSSYTTGTFYNLEIGVTVADAGGTVVVKSNGVTLINFTGDTKNAGTSTNIDAVGLGANTGVTAYFDDLYVANSTGSAPYNTYLGDIRISTLVPNGAGSDTNFTPSTGANYTTVDELPYSATDYVSASASGTRDLYATTDVGGSYTVLAVQNNVIAKKTDAGGTSIKPAIKSGGTVYYGSTAVLTVGDLVTSDLRTTDPATSTAWTTTGVNNLEIGMEIV